MNIVLRTGLAIDLDLVEKVVVRGASGEFYFTKGRPMRTVVYADDKELLKRELGDRYEEQDE